MSLQRVSFEPGCSTEKEDIRGLMRQSTRENFLTESSLGEVHFDGLMAGEATFNEKAFIVFLPVAFSFFVTIV